MGRRIEWYDFGYSHHFDLARSCNVLFLHCFSECMYITYMYICTYTCIHADINTIYTPLWHSCQSWPVCRDNMKDLEVWHCPSMVIVHARRTKMDPSVFIWPHYSSTCTSIRPLLSPFPPSLLFLSPLSPLPFNSFIGAKSYAILLSKGLCISPCWNR